MSDELRKRVRDKVATRAGCKTPCRMSVLDCACLNTTDAAIALIRAEVLEEAARVVALMPRTYDKIKQDHDVLGMKGTWTFTLNNGPAECAAAIRALKDRT